MILDYEKKISYKRKIFFWVILCLSFMFLQQATSEAISVLGIDTGSEWDYNIVSYLSNVTFTEVSTTSFATVDLDLYDVLLISETFLNGSVTVPAQTTLNALNSREGDLSSWINAGHGVVALSEPIGVGRFSWLPDTIQPIIGTQLGDDTVRIVDSTHPVMQGLTDYGLSGWGCSSHGNYVGFSSTGGLEVLVDDGDTGRAITLAGSFGFGKVIITDQDPDFHRFYGTVDQQAQFVQAECYRLGCNS